MSGELENAGQRRVGGGEKKERMDCVAEDRGMFGITEELKSRLTTMDPGA